MMSENRPKISVIVPIYNVEKYLDRCVESLIGQTLEDIEIILVDDGSPDRCPQMCDDWATRDSRIGVVHKKNGGLGDARNAGLDVASGEYVAFVDSDDYLLSETLATLWDEAIAGRWDVIFNGNRYYAADGSSADYCVHDIKCIGREAVDNHLKKMLYEDENIPQDKRIVVSVCMGIFRREVIEKYHVRFETKYISEDLLFQIDLMSHCERVCCIPYAFYQYCYNGTSITQGFRETKIPNLLEQYEVVVAKLKQHGYADLEWRAMMYFLNNMIALTKQIIFSNESIMRKRALCRMIYNYGGWKHIFKTTKDAPIKRRERLLMMLIKHKMFFANYCMYMLYYRLLKK